MRMGGNNGEVSVAARLVRVALVMAGLAAAVVVAVSAGAISLPSGGVRGTTTQASDRSVLAAGQAAADKRWASSTCTSILDWKNEIHRDETSVNLSFGPVARIRDAIAATHRMISEIDRLGLPPGAGGNRAAIDKILGDLEHGKVSAPQITGELAHIASVDLGLSIVETRACRELVGSPV